MVTGIRSVCLEFAVCEDLLAAVLRIRPLIFPQFSRLGGCKPDFLVLRTGLPILPCHGLLW